jgi:hypothetical protein
MRTPEEAFVRQRTGCNKDGRDASYNVGNESAYDCIPGIFNPYGSEINSKDIKDVR